MLFAELHYIYIYIYIYIYMCESTNGGKTEDSLADTACCLVVVLLFACLLLWLFSVFLGANEHRKRHYQFFFFVSHAKQMIGMYSDRAVGCHGPYRTQKCMSPRQTMSLIKELK